MLLRLKDNDTIAAIATPVGEGGISVIRISGPDAFKVSGKIFVGKIHLENAPSHTAHFGDIHDSEGKFIDKVVAVCYRMPRSYTGEDVVEISCHGGYLVTRKVFNAALAAGARSAEPGEFTKRAFLNGRIDLSQAEAVGDLIHSQSEAAYQSSLRQLSGELSRALKGIRDELMNLASLLELELDFSEEDVKFVDRTTLEDRLANAIVRVDALLESYTVGRLFREGVRVTIAGKPNVGKSSLLNALLQEERAIVSDIPGTTRDTITEAMSINGILFRFTDTAGLRETTDQLEREGVRRAERQTEAADIVLLVADYQEHDYNGSDQLYAKLYSACRARSVKVATVWNKIDLYETLAPRQAQSLPEFYVSALHGDGIDSLKIGLFDLMATERMSEKSVVVTNTRHREALERARRSLSLALASLREHRPGELIALDLRAGLNFLGEITGEVTTDDILNNIFSKFCIGK